MFSGILSSDSEIIVFERNVSDLFFSATSPRPRWPTSPGGRWSSTPTRCSSASSPAPTTPSSPASASPPPTPASAKPPGSKAPAPTSRSDADDVVLGQRAAEFLHAHLNSTVAIGHGIFHVTGIIQTANGFEDGGVFMPLAAAQNFFHKHGASSVITIKLHRQRRCRRTSSSAVKAKFPDLIALEDAGVHPLLLAVQDPQSHRLGGRRLRPLPRRPRRRQHHDHVGLHAHPRDRHPPRQRLLQSRRSPP